MGKTVKVTTILAVTVEVAVAAVGKRVVVAVVPTTVSVAVVAILAFVARCVCSNMVAVTVVAGLARVAATVAVANVSLVAMQWCNSGSNYVLKSGELNLTVAFMERM